MYNIVQRLINIYHYDDIFFFFIKNRLFSYVSELINSQIETVLQGFTRKIFILV